MLSAAAAAEEVAELAELLLLLLELHPARAAITMNDAPMVAVAEENFMVTFVPTLSSSAQAAGVATGPSIMPVGNAAAAAPP